MDEVFNYYPDHDCTIKNEYIKVADAARRAGVVYQYIFGICQRSFNARRPRYSVRRQLKVTPHSLAVEYGVAVDDPLGIKTAKPKMEYRICWYCVKQKYGEEKSEADETVLIASPVIGYRSWHLRPTSLLLYSWGGKDANFIWGPEGATAQCKRTHKIPDRNHTCGLYALNLPDLNAYTADVYGQVELWGKVIEGDRGWRAQHGKPTALLCYKWEIADRIHDVADMYGIPVTHSLRLLRETNWGEQTAFLKSIGMEGIEDGHRRNAEGTGSYAERDPDGGASRIAPCRAAIRGAKGSLDDIRRLGKEGLISKSNLEELVEWED